MLVPSLLICLISTVVESYISQSYGQRPIYCDQKVEQRPCKAFLWRYTYDTSENKCKLFVFGGCSESLNIFRSKKLCEKTCKKINEENNERAIETLKPTTCTFETKNIFIKTRCTILNDKRTTLIGKVVISSTKNLENLNGILVFNRSIQKNICIFKNKAAKNNPYVEKDSFYDNKFNVRTYSEIKPGLSSSYIILFKSC